MPSIATDPTALPLSARLARRVRRWFGIDRERRWNTQYADGVWDRLHDLDELAHHSVLAGYAAFFKPDAALLDVGCGDGVFLTQLRDRYGSYVGLDFAEPIRRAQERANERTHFAVADINEFTTDDRFDAIVFNETLYYLHDPLAGLRRYRRFLAPNGVLLISMHETPRNRALWEGIDAEYRVLDAVTLTNQRGTQWVTKALAGTTRCISPPSASPYQSRTDTAPHP